MPPLLHFERFLIINTLNCASVEAAYNEAYQDEWRHMKKLRHKMQAKTLMYYPKKKCKKNAHTCHSMSHSAVAPLQPPLWKQAGGWTTCLNRIRCKRWLQPLGLNCIDWTIIPKVGGSISLTHSAGNLRETGERGGCKAHLIILQFFLSFVLSKLLDSWRPKPRRSNWCVIEESSYQKQYLQHMYVTRCASKSDVGSLKGRHYKADTSYSSCLWVLHSILPCLLCFLSAPQSM